jgi:enamine deaminase RidA (YjgF/YER057c/UK114 family)
MPTDHYCVIGDVNALCGQVPFTATSRPTDSQVTGFIAQVAREMDSMLKNVGYVVPIVAGANALESARETCAWGALGLAQTVRDTGVTTAVNASSNERENIWSQKYRARMKALTDAQNPYEWDDAPRTNEQLEKQPENVLRSMAQGITDDTSYDPNAPVVSRYQVL